ncbi:16S rRNA (cytosine(967)-C(5))-methyltransferase RsmB [Aliikangiella sp. G2MR2-5]|uniref:16S rRNA (cytosine(967)-C(5))-methyltransferase RsmB n=1 Tax=Aliikangiella sp. G2MR2-5 TaxID=2788943 RepID=UPI0018A94C51|nr:16S rRNA (cytosine(967)-C(5))-methyltransferase RsmB [Aliikangiella sp. G2MR2-5]
MSEARLKALNWLVAVENGRSVNEILATENSPLPPQQTAQAKQLLFGSLRYYHRLNTILDNLLAKPLKAKDSDLKVLLIMGLYQLDFMSTPDHAAISESVELTRTLGKPWASKLVNGVLRSYQREKLSLTKRLEKAVQYRFSHPGWIVKRLKTDWPEVFEEILSENNRQAPMTIRVNTLKNNLDDYLLLLESNEIKAKKHPLAKDGLVLEKAVGVAQLPGFEQGKVTVQDAAPQLVVDMLQLETAKNVVDGCAAPGGKTTHMLQRNPHVKLVAVELSSTRAEKIQQTFERMGIYCELVCEDFVQVEKWAENRKFDRILLDVPCSASGVIRRNPDIKIHRKSEDVKALIEIQRKILEKGWELLEPGGILLYATCSVFKAENEQQIATFLKQNSADVLPIPLAWEGKLNNPASIGCQILPGELEMDGFYLCALQKPASWLES